MKVYLALTHLLSFASFFLITSMSGEAVGAMVILTLNYEKLQNTGQTSCRHALQLPAHLIIMFVMMMMVMVMVMVMWGTGGDGGVTSSWQLDFLRASGTQAV